MEQSFIPTAQAAIKDIKSLIDYIQAHDEAPASIKVDGDKFTTALFITETSDPTAHNLLLESLKNQY